MSLFDEIRAGKALKKVPESEKKDRSTLDGMKKVAASSATAPAGSSVAEPTRFESPTPSAPPVGLGGLFANGVPKLRPSGSRAPGPDSGIRSTPVAQQPAFQPNPAAPVARFPTTRASGPVPAVPPRGFAPPPPPPTASARVVPVPVPSVKPTAPAPRVGLPSNEENVPRPAFAGPKVIHINSRLSPSSGAGQPQPPPPPPPPTPPSAPQPASTMYGGQPPRAHPPAPPPPPPPSMESGLAATTLASEFERRFRFLNEQQLPPPPLPYHGVRTYKAKQNRAVPHPTINMPNGPTYPQ